MPRPRPNASIPLRSPLPGEVRQFVNTFGAMMEAEGLPRQAGRILALLFVWGRDSTAAELAEQLEMSRSNVSTNVRVLETLGLVIRTQRAGSRLEDIGLPRDPFRAMLAASVSRATRLSGLVSELRHDLPAAWRGTGERLQELERFFHHATEWIGAMAAAWPPEPATATGAATGDGTPVTSAFSRPGRTGTRRR